LNEPWPAISWALIDFYGKTKPAYKAVQRVFCPLLVSLDFPSKSYLAGDSIPIDVWIINDRIQTLTGCELEVVLRTGTGKVVERFAQQVDVTPRSACRTGQVRWSLPAGSDWNLSGQLSRQGQTLALNEYDLTVADDIQPTPRQRLRTSLTSLFLPS
jgi:hypothetical protein